MDVVVVRARGDILGVDIRDLNGRHAECRIGDRGVLERDNRRGVSIRRVIRIGVDREKDRTPCQVKGFNPIGLQNVNTDEPGVTPDIVLNDWRLGGGNYCRHVDNFF